MHDVLVDASPRWQHAEQTIQAILERYAYQQIRLPVVERTDLFERSIGESSDIVTKEMYTFTDRNGDRLTLRPEGTAGCVRAGLEHALFYDRVLRLWYIGPMFRRERPQKGRLRQFHQIGVEAFGLPGPDIDAEIIIMCTRIWAELGLEDITLQINTLGTAASRQRYRRILTEYFSDHHAALDEDSRQRLQHNPLRILDSKNPSMRPLLESAPVMDEYLDGESNDHFFGLKTLLDAANINYEVNPRLVRGLDYYGKTVFEWITDRLGTQGTICAGGRYDGLVQHFGGKPVPAAGLALGLERVLDLMDTATPCGQALHAYFIVATDKARPVAYRLAEQIRDKLPDLR
ncbi:MAG: histidine--tRNA ligase, partial [Gammaproteobacteria bacterium]